MLELNCENLDSACRTLTAILGIPESEFQAALQGYSIHDFEKDLAARFEKPESVLWKKVVGAEEPPTPSSVVWFHATRTRPEVDYAQGILPLGKLEAQLIRMVEEIAAGIGVKRVDMGDDRDPAREQGGFHFSLKTTDPKFHGPYAFLTRDAILDPGPSTGDYLGAPEIVVDIAGMLFGPNSDRVIEAFRVQTRPRIVHFRSSAPREDVLEIALRYCHAGIHNQMPLGEYHTCFDGGGFAVPLRSIIRVEDLNA